MKAPPPPLLYALPKCDATRFWVFGKGFLCYVKSVLRARLFVLLKFQEFITHCRVYKSFVLNALIDSTRGRGLFRKNSFDTYTNVSRPFVGIPFPLLYSHCTTTEYYICCNKHTKCTLEGGGGNILSMYLFLKSSLAKIKKNTIHIYL